MRVKFFPNAEPLIARYAAEDFDLLRLDEQGFYNIVIVFIVVLVPLYLLTNRFNILHHLESPWLGPSNKASPETEWKFTTHIHHVIQARIPVLYKLEHAWVALIFVDLTEDIQRLRTHVPKGGFQGLKEGLCVGGVNSDFDVD